MYTERNNYTNWPILSQFDLKKLKKICDFEDKLTKYWSVLFPSVY